MHIKHLLAIGVTVIGTAALPSFSAEATLKGAFVLPGITEKVTAELVVLDTGPWASNTTKLWLSLRQSRPDPSIRSLKRPS